MAVAEFLIAANPDESSKLPYIGQTPVDHRAA
jgi:hypothetical protein